MDLPTFGHVRNINPIGQHAVKAAVVFDKAWTLGSGNLPYSIIDGIFRNIRVNLGQGFTQPFDKDDFAVTRPLPEGEGRGEGIAVRRYVRAEQNLVAEGFKPLESGLFKDVFC